ncbi:outer membrane protein assembly factor BamB family protein [Actinomadura montaniterrae]|uniref:PQQ-binding-like beta-propeller repeat protein n=1 Tax=Actinomadura montaniterrae TaxID=1803903 RepID=A0A6L3W0Y7_9ACTN|nr:PQQ-binding-like beta-propeller repeat protein [Actinomadura montaniterrae]KAB2385919.1 PQQ-binding-like beta-propeller repeat protein [Actinomadura montaniterrae]
MSGGGGRLGAALGWLRRPWAIGAFVLVLVGAGAAGLLMQRPDDGMRGPFGPPPDDLTYWEPVTSARPVATFPATGAFIVEGVAISTGPNGPGGGVHAVRITTGREYWHYDRPAEPIAVVLERTVVARSSDDPRSLVLINAESGRLLRSFTVPGIGAIEHAFDFGPALVVYGREGVAGLSLNGELQWSKRLPADLSCDPSPHSPALLDDKDDAFAFVCGDGAHVIGFNIRHGWRWTTDLAHLSSSGGRSGEIRSAGCCISGKFAVLIRDHSDAPAPVLVLDSATGRVEKRIHTPVVSSFGFTTDGRQVGLCPLPRGGQSVCLNDFKSGRNLWSTRVPDGLRVAEDLPLPAHTTVFWADTSTPRDDLPQYVYVLARSATGSNARILVIDLTSGFPTGHWQLGQERDGIRFTGIDIANSSHSTLAIHASTSAARPMTYLYADDTHTGNEPKAFTKLLANPRQLFVR